MKFRKKPVVIEAVRWDNSMEAYKEIQEWKPEQFPSAFHPDEKLRIVTLEGIMEASVGDWVIRGVKGEIYPCKPDIFDATYDPVIDLEAALSPVSDDPNQDWD